VPLTRLAPSALATLSPQNCGERVHTELCARVMRLHDEFCDRKATLRRYSKRAADCSTIVAKIFSHNPSSSETAQSTGDAMRDTLDKGIPDTAPYKEWLGIVGSMMAAVLICVVLFSAGFLT
jgi:hypothetical protein